MAFQVSPFADPDIAAAAPFFVTGWQSLAKPIYEIGVAAGFYKEPFNDGEKIALMHSELSEALEGLRHGPFPGVPDEKLPHRPAVEVELADAVIRIMNYATHRGLDVSGAIIEKAAFNRTRADHQGGEKKF